MPEWHLVDQKEVKYPPEKPIPIKGFGVLLAAILGAGALIEYLKERK